MTREEHRMSNENAELIRGAYWAYASGDLDGMLELVDPDLEWMPGGDAHHGGRGNDRVYSVFTVREGRIVALRDCRDRQEALQLAAIKT